MLQVALFAAILAVGDTNMRLSTRDGGTFTSRLNSSQRVVVRQTCGGSDTLIPLPPTATMQGSPDIDSADGVNYVVTFISDDNSNPNQTVYRVYVSVNGGPPVLASQPAPFNTNLNFARVCVEGGNIAVTYMPGNWSSMVLYLSTLNISGATSATPVRIGFGDNNSEFVDDFRTQQYQHGTYNLGDIASNSGGFVVTYVRNVAGQQVVNGNSTPVYSGVYIQGFTIPSLVRRFGETVVEQDTSSQGMGVFYYSFSEVDCANAGGSAVLYNKGSQQLGQASFAASGALECLDTIAVGRNGEPCLFAYDREFGIACDKSNEQAVVIAYESPYQNYHQSSGYPGSGGGNGNGATYAAIRTKCITGCAYVGATTRTATIGDNNGAPTYGYPAVAMTNYGTFHLDYQGIPYQGSPQPGTNPYYYCSVTCP